MKRVLSLVLALVLVLGMIPTFAADMTAGQHLFEHEFIAGDGNGNLMEDQLLTREQLAKLILELNGSLEEAEALTLPPSFTDSAKISAWARPYVAYAQIEGLMIGYTDGSFRPQEGVSGQQLAQVLTRALGYEFTWATVVADAADLGIDVAVAAKLTRGQAFEAMWTTVNTNPKDGDKPLGVVLGKLEDTTPAPVGAVAVKSVVANNLKSMVVEFNKPVNKDTITATTVKAVKGTTNVVESRLLSEDGMTLTIVYTSGAVTQSSEVKLTVNGVKSADKTEEIKDYTSTTVVNDVVIPEVLSVKALNAKQLEVFFSEPMNITASNAFSVISGLKINNVAAIAKVTHNYTTNSVVFELSNVLEAKTHTVEVKDFTDFATYKAITKTMEFTVVEDKAAPVLTSAEAKAINKIEVTFSESVSTTGSFWVNGVSATATPVANSNNTKFELTGFNALDLAAIIQIKVEYQNQKDVVGNTVSTKTTYTFNVQDDTTLPTVTAAVSTGNKITLTFSKAMLTNTGTIQILKSTKAAHSSIINVTTFKANSGDMVLELAASATGLDGINAGTYYVNIKGMKDATVRGNALTEQVIEITALDTKAPTVVGGYSVSLGTVLSPTADFADDDTITFYFSEAMDVDTLKNLSNYVYSGTAFSAITGVSYKSSAADGKSVTLTYPNAGTFVGQTFTIYALKDVAGNMIETATGVAKLNTGFGVSATAYATAGDKVKVTFNTPMANVDPSFIKVTQTVSAVTSDYAVPVSATIGGTNNNEVTFTLNKSIGTSTAGFTVVILNKTLATDVYGQAYATGDTPATISTFVDQVRPTLVSVTQKYVDPNASPLVKDANKILVKFSEELAVINEANLKNDLILKYSDGTPIAAAGYSVANLGANSDTLLITLNPNAKLTDGTDSITVQLFADRELKDVATPTAKFAVPFEAKTVEVLIAGNAQALAVAAIEAMNVANDAAALTIAQLTTAGAVRLDAANLAAYKAAIAGAAATGADSTVKIQAIVDQVNVTAIAAAIPATFAATGAVNAVVVPTVPAGYTIAVKTSATPANYSAGGALLQDGTSVVVFTVTHTVSTLTADTGNVTVTVDVTP